jgi:hypothetical protein
VTVSPLGADLITTVPNAPRYARVPPVIADSSPAAVEVGATPAKLLFKARALSGHLPVLGSSVSWDAWHS